MTKYPNYKPGDQVRILRMDTVPRDPSPELRAAMHPSHIFTVEKSWVLEMQDGTNFQSLDLYGWPFMVNCDDIERA